MEASQSRGVESSDLFVFIIILQLIAVYFLSLSGFALSAFN